MHKLHMLYVVTDFPKILSNCTINSKCKNSFLHVAALLNPSDFQHGSGLWDDLCTDKKLKFFLTDLGEGPPAVSSARADPIRVL